MGPVGYHPKILTATVAAGAISRHCEHPYIGAPYRRADKSRKGSNSPFKAVMDLGVRKFAPVKGGKPDSLTIISKTAERVYGAAAC
jgi:hypothetical protein